MLRGLLCLHIASVMVLFASLLTLRGLTLVRGPADTAAADGFAEFMRELIATPALIAVLASGVTLLSLERTLLTQPWLYLKLALVGALLAVSSDLLTPRWAQADEAPEEDAARPTTRFPRAALLAAFVLLLGIVATVVVRPFAQ